MRISSSASVGSMLLFFGLGCCCLAGRSAVAASMTVFDDFEDGGPFLLQTSSGHSSDSIDQGGLAVVGGHREIHAYRHMVTIETTVELPSTPGDDALRISGLGLSTGQGASVTAIYNGGRLGGDLNLNLSELGDRFFMQLSVDPGPDVGWLVLVTDGAGATYGITGSYQRRFDGSGYHEIPFSEYTDAFPGLDLSEVDKLYFQIDYYGGPAVVEVAQWGVVPEPSSFVLASIAGVLLIAWRLRRR